MRVQRYGERRVGTDPLKGGQRSAAETAESLGGGGGGDAIGQALEHVGGQFVGMSLRTMHDLAEKERDAADQVALLKAQNKADAWEMATLHDPKSGVYTTRGEDAFNKPEIVAADWQKITGEIEKDFTSDRQRLMWAKEKAQRTHNIALGVNRHVAGERRTFEETELKATLENVNSLAAANSGDVKRVSRELERGEAAIAKAVDRWGLGPEAKKAQLEGFRSGVHISVLNNMLANEQDKAAAIYFQEVKSQISGEKLDEITKAIEVGGRKKDAQARADEILKAGGTLTEQRKKAKDTIADPDTRKMVEATLEHEAAVAEREEREQLEGLTLQATNIVEKAGRFDAIPAVMLAKLPLGTRSALQNYAQDKARGVPTETNPAVYYGYMGMAANEPEAFIKTNLLENRDKLSDSDLERLAQLQLNMRTGKRAAADKDLAGYRQRADIVNGTLSQYGIDTKAANQTTAQKASIAQLERMIDLRVEAIQGDTGKKVDNVQLQRIVDDLLTNQIDVPGTFYGTTKKRIIDLTIDDVPEDKKREIRHKMALRRMPVNDTTILNAYIEDQVK